MGMNDAQILDTPVNYTRLLAKCEEIGFTMPSDIYIGTLLKTLIASKPKANILELGTGIRLSLAWMIEGLDPHSELTSIDNDPQLIQIAEDFFGSDQRVHLVCQDGSIWINQYQGAAFDLIFADAWPGKYSDLEPTLTLIKPGGFYVIDDLKTQPNWPEGHEANVDRLIEYLEGRTDFTLTKLDWGTGVIIMTKKAI